jgi:hypothetical protein
MQVLHRFCGVLALSRSLLTPASLKFRSGYKAGTSSVSVISLASLKWLLIVIFCKVDGPEFKVMTADALAPLKVTSAGLFKK